MLGFTPKEVWRLTLREWKQQYDLWQEYYDFKLTGKTFNEAYQEQQAESRWF